MTDFLAGQTRDVLAPIQQLKEQGLYGWMMLALAVIMFGSWTGTYIAVIRKGFKDKTYGIPFVNTCLNFSWEMIFSFNLLGYPLPKFYFPLRLGHLLWLIPNSLNVYLTLRHGPAIQKSPFVRKHFRILFVLTFAACFLLMITYHRYAHDIYGVASSWMINALMSWLFIRMLMDRKHELSADKKTIRGMTLTGAWLKLTGNAAGAIFCVFWWRDQFSTASLAACSEEFRAAVVAAPHRYICFDNYLVIEPNYLFLYCVYTLNVLLDAVLIYMLYQRQRDLRMTAGSIPGTGPAATVA